MNGIYRLKNEKDTENLGINIAGQLKKGSVIALTGDLGAGKTTLTKAIARGLGIKETLTSPTFTIVCEYESGRLPLYHFDVYRIHDADELFEIGFDEYMHRGGVCIVEWADLLDEDMLPLDTIHINMSYGEPSSNGSPEENERICIIK